jgi:long-chain acyl-CoA synthetase
MEGIGILATNLGVPVVPVRLDGLYEMKVSRRYFARPGEVRVTIGEPVEFARDADPATIARELQQRVASL